VFGTITGRSRGHVIILEEHPIGTENADESNHDGHDDTTISKRSDPSCSSVSSWVQDSSGVRLKADTTRVSDVAAMS